VNLDLNGPELVTNGTFDANVTGWTFTTGVTGAYETVIKRTGAGSAKLTSDGTAQGTMISTAIPNTSTNKFTCEFWAYIPASSTGRQVNILIVNESNGALVAGSNITLTADTWTKLVVNGQLPGTQTAIKARLRYVNPSAGDVMYVDDVSLKQAYDVLISALAKTSDNSANIMELCDWGITAGSATSSRISLFKNASAATIQFNYSGISGTISSSGGVINDGVYHIIQVLLNRTGNQTLYIDGVQIDADAITGQQMSLSPDVLSVGYKGVTASTATYWNGSIAGVQIVRFSSLPADGGASIIADAYNRFRSRRPFATAYPGGTVVASYDWKNQGRDISGNGNDLTLVGGPPIIKI
jgi:hypothetical protein